MLDIRFVREHPDEVKENIKKKFQDAKLPLVDEVINLDAEYRAAIGEGDTLRANRNKLSKQIGMLMGQAKKDPSKAAEAEEIKKQVTAQADRLKELETKEAELQDKIRDIMYTIPQMIDQVCPSARTTAAMWKYSALAILLCRIIPSRTMLTSWKALTALTWMLQAAFPATASTICWATLPACTKLFWLTPAIL